MRRPFAVPFLALLGALGCSTAEPTKPAGSTTVAETSGPGSAAAMATTTATVEDVDQKTRMVTLRTAEGEKVEFRAGDEVRNLAQVRRGDVVTATYYESLALALRPASGEKPSVTVADETERAPLGAKPGALAVREVTITAKVTKVDRAGKRVTLEGPKGNAVTLKVDDAKKLDDVTVGKLVEARYREAVAITVSKPE